MTLTNRELATVLAALRYWQANLEEDNGAIIKGDMHFETEAPLTAEAIDGLCERLNGPDEELEELRAQVDSANEAADGYEARANRLARKALEAESKAEEISRDAEYKDDERQRITRDLERARSWGNDYEEQRCLDKLKHL